MPPGKKRLTKSDWFQAGFSALVADGPDALKAEALAREIGATKGSFYWHFKDISDFRAQLVAQWEIAAVAALSRSASASTTAGARLQSLPDIMAPVRAGASGTDPEPIIRAWALYNHTVADAVKDVDAARMSYIRSVLDALGLTNPDFARLLYGAQLGLRTLPGGADETASALSSLTAALMALQDA